MRLLISVLKINTDLERMGDLAVNVAERALTLIQEPLPELVRHIRTITRLVEDMVRLSLESFVQKSAPLAFDLLKTDDEVDSARDRIYEEALVMMQENPAAIPMGLGIMSIARNLERIADHATNVAEDVIFAVHGMDVRHHREA